ncbi:MAG: hypothetical protein ACYTDY_16170, partial [Planctomycetota bacterium]
TPMVPKYRDEAYSVIAKLESDTGAGAASADGKLSVAQWFATGEAAKTLAKQPGIAGAVSGSSEIARAAALEPEFLKSKEISKDVKVAAFWTTFRALDDVEKAQAKAHLAAVKAFAVRYKTQDFVQYIDTGDEDKPVVRSEKKHTITHDNWQILLAYQENLEDSIAALDDLILDGEYKELRKAGDPPTRPGPDRLKELLKERDDQRALLAKFEDALHKEESIAKAFEYFAQLLKGE